MSGFQFEQDDPRDRLMVSGAMIGEKTNRTNFSKALMIILGFSSLVLFGISLYPVVFGFINDLTNDGVFSIEEIWFVNQYVVITMGAAIAGLFTLGLHSAEGHKMKTLTTVFCAVSGLLALLAFSYGGVFAGIWEGIRWSAMGNSDASATPELLATWNDHKTLFRANYFVIVLGNGVFGLINFLGYTALTFLTIRGNMVNKND